MERKKRLERTSGESVTRAVAEKGEEERGRGSQRDRVGEKCREINTPLKTEML